MGREVRKHLNAIGLCLVGVILQSCVAPNAVLSFPPIPINNSSGNTSNLNTFFVSGPSAISVNTCQAYVVNSESSGGVALPVSTPLMISFGTQGSAGFFTDVNCFTGNAAITLPAQASTVTIYFRATVSGTFPLQVWASGYMTSTLNVTVGTTAGSASKLVFTTEPSSSATTGTAFATQPVIAVQDSVGNIVTSYSTAVILRAYQDASCSVAVTNGSLNMTGVLPSAGLVHVSTLDYLSNSTSTIYIQASSGGLNSACSTAVSVSVPMVSIATAGASACAVSSAGYVYCWGDNSYGELGNGTTTTSGIVSQVVGVGGVGNLSNIISISGSDYEFCAVSLAGNVYCWGAGLQLQLGDNTSVSSATPVEVLGPTAGYLSGIAAVEVGYQEACALTSGGNVYCWGTSDNGGLGAGGTLASGISVEVLGLGGSGFLSGVTSISVGAYSACGVSSGNVYCWGANPSGVLGDNNAVTSAFTPIQVLGVGGTGLLSNISKVSVGGATACAVSLSGLTFCWGNNGNGELGNGVTSGSFTTPVQVVGTNMTGTLAGINQVSVGEENSTCAVDTSGEAYCWGANGSGQLGDGGNTDANDPVQTIAAGVSSISVGQSFSCALMTSGHVECWGDNSLGQLGQATTGGSQTTPIEVKGEFGSGFL